MHIRRGRTVPAKDLAAPAKDLAVQVRQEFRSMPGRLGSSGGKGTGRRKERGTIMQSELLIVIPAYNEEKNIENVVTYIRDKYPQYDYVVVNDGSKDRTAEICREKRYELLDLPTNLGLAGAFQAGLKYAYTKGYSYAIQFDADGQHRPEFIQAMLDRIKEGYDIVIGSRFLNQKKSSSLRMLGSRILTVAIKMTTRVRVSDPTSGMRMFSRPMIKEFAQNLNYGPEPDTVSYLLKNGAKISEVQVKMDERQFGESYLNLLGSARYMIRMLISIFFVQNFRKRG